MRSDNANTCYYQEVLIALGIAFIYSVYAKIRG